MLASYLRALALTPAPKIFHFFHISSKNFFYYKDMEMGLKDIAHIIEADQKKTVMHHTWGHLFPKDSSVFKGSIHVCLTDYNDLVVIKDLSGVESSPWWFDAINDFASDFLMKKDMPGAVFKIDIQVSILKEGKFRHFKIKKLSEKILLK